MAPQQGESCPRGSARDREVAHPDRSRARRSYRWVPGEVLHRSRSRRDPLPRTGGQLRRQDHRHATPSRPGDPRPMPTPRLCRGGQGPARRGVATPGTSATKYGSSSA
jgi:hypothetical protein